MSVSYNAKNQPSNMYFDANGNGGGWTYSVENKMVWQTLDYQTGAANLYAYDPSGKRVMSGSDSNPYTSPQPNYTYSFYAITGQRLATLNCNGSNYPAYPVCAITGQNVYFGGKLIVSGGVNVVTDRLGTVRANGQGESFAYYPFGEERTNRPDGRDKFATYFRDAVGQDYADQRYYSSGSGRFNVPDPMGMRSATLGSPGSWNRYAYVYGDPVNFNDRSGRMASSVGACGTDGGQLLCDLDSGGGAGAGPGNDPTLGGGGCILDAVTTDCAIVAGLQFSGAAAAIPPGLSSATPGIGQFLTAIQTPSCAGLFGMGNTSPLTLLSQVNVNVRFEDLGNPDLYGETWFPNLQGNPMPGQYLIIINTAKPQYLANGGTENANTLIHELLHVAVDMGYQAPQGWFQNDGAFPGAGEPGNNNMIVNACGVGTLWP